jgi:3-methyl-2-oxobutanoate hydroxymethyltransferase
MTRQAQPPKPDRKVTTLRLQEMKVAKEKISALTAYDFLTARLLDQAGIDVILVGDSASMVFAGNDTTVPMKMDEMLYHVRVVTRAVKRALVVADMPFMSYRKSAEEALGNAARLMQDGMAEAVKMEGGRSLAPIVERVVDAGIPVMGHVGLQPQSIHTYGTYKTRGMDELEAEKIIDAARAFESAGAFAVVIEKVPMDLARRITEMLKNSHHRHRRGWQLRWPNSGHARHARHEHPVSPTLRAQICQVVGRNGQSLHSLSPRCEG